MRVNYVGLQLAQQFGGADGCFGRPAVGLFQTMDFGARVLDLGCHFAWTLHADDRDALTASPAFAYQIHHQTL